MLLHPILGWPTEIEGLSNSIIMHILPNSLLTSISTVTPQNHLDVNSALYRKPIPQNPFSGESCLITGESPKSSGDIYAIKCASLNTGAWEMYKTRLLDTSRGHNSPVRDPMILKCKKWFMKNSKERSFKRLTKSNKKRYSETTKCKSWD